MLICNAKFIALFGGASLLHLAIQSSYVIVIFICQSLRIQLVNEFSHLPPGARLQSNRREKGQKKGDDLSAELTCDPAFTPHAIYKLWNDSRTDVVEGRQEDAEEFLGFVLNQINDEMLEVSIYDC